MKYWKVSKFLMNDLKMNPIIYIITYTQHFTLFLCIKIDDFFGAYFCIMATKKTKLEFLLQMLGFL
jgi:hypothetical protein